MIGWHRSAELDHQIVDAVSVTVNDEAVERSAHAGRVACSVRIDDELVAALSELEVRDGYRERRTVGEIETEDIPATATGRNVSTSTSSEVERVVAAFAKEPVVAALAPDSVVAGLPIDIVVA